jgi:Prophage tail fibre N-terminal
MSIKISGILPGPTGEPAAHIGITLRAVKTSLTVITSLESNSITGEDGSYSLNVEPGKYDVLLWLDGISARMVGTINVYSDSLPGTLNNFLTALREEDGTPEIILQIEQLRAEAVRAALEAKASKDEATHQAGIATGAAENAAQEAVELIRTAVKDDADRAEAAREGAETAQSAVNVQASEVSLLHTKVGQLASAAEGSAAAAASSSNSATESASKSDSSKNAAAKSEQAAIASAKEAENSATVTVGYKAAAEGFRNEAEGFAAMAKASAESIDMSVLEEQINQKVNRTDFDEAIAGTASNEALADGLAKKASTQQLTDGLAEKASTQQLEDGLASKMPTSGGTMTGPITLSADAVNPLEPVTLQQLDAKPSGGLPLLFSWWEDNREHIPEGTAPRDGQELSRALFPDAWAAAQAKGLVITEAEWQADPLKRMRWSSGNGTTTFRLPDENGKSPGSVGAPVRRGDGAKSNGVTGTIQMDAIRNIKGTYSSDNNGSVWLDVDPLNVTGVFGQLGSVGNTAKFTTSAYTIASGSHQLEFDASRVVPTAEENRMLNATGCYVIKLAGAAFNEGQINALELATEISLLTSRIVSLESDAFTENKVATTPWTPLTLQNGWSALNPYRNGYRKILGLLFIEASILAGTLVDGTTITTFPVGFRVAAPIICTITGISQPVGSVSTRLAITPDGNCKVYGTSGVGSALSINIAVSLQ